MCIRDSIYSDSTSGSNCASATIPTSSCRGRMCSHIFEVSSSFCLPSADINVTVFATNILGEGQYSIPVTTGYFTHVTLMGDNNFIIMQRPSTLVLVWQLTCLPQLLLVSSSTSTISTTSPVLLNMDPVKAVEVYLIVVKTSFTHFPLLLLISPPILDSTLNQCTALPSLQTMVLIPQKLMGDLTQVIVIIIMTNTFDDIIINNYHFEACSPADLTDGTPPPDDVTCGAPFFTLGIKSGMVCYTRTDIGAVAAYSCLECGVYSLRGSPVRSCLPDGSWNGSIPQCDCGKC